MATTIQLDPVTRIEGHLAVRTEVTDGRITGAWVAGEMFRGFEVILRGRDPRDAQQITQRICGVCPIEHGVASVLAQEAAAGVEPPPNGRVVRNLGQAANFIASHITHFYLLSSPDFVDIARIQEYPGNDPGLLALKAWVNSEVGTRAVLPAAPFLPRYAAEYLQDPELNFTAIRHYLEALEMRRVAHEMAALFLGKIPHAATLVPGGVTEHVTALKIAAFRSHLARLQVFIDTAYLPDVMAVATAFPAYFVLGAGCGNFLAYGVFPEEAAGASRFFPSGVLAKDELQDLKPEAITEDVTHSRFSSPTGLKPELGETVPAPGKSGAYSWLKAPRYRGQPMEVGPLARVLVAARRPEDHAVKALLETSLNAVGQKPQALASVMGRHLARALECKVIADRCGKWLDELVPDAPTLADHAVPVTARGCGLTEAARGALGHWIDIRDRRIHSYQCVVPTTWNCSPRDDRGTLGPIEQALLGTPVADPQNPIEAARVVRSFDPCLACAVH